MTIQLDGLGRQLSELKTDPGTPEASDGPVFVDESGRRSKNFRRAGWLVAAACTVFAVVLVSSLFGGSSVAPWLPLTSQEQKKADEDKGGDTPAADPSNSTGVAGITDPGATTGPTPGAGATDAASPGATGSSASASTGASASDPAESPAAGTPAGSSATTGGGSSPKPSAPASATKPVDTPTTDPVQPTSPTETTEPTTEPPVVSPESSTP
ncbi:hypothetical protein [Streptomyces sp. NPDC060198]|uniref:hypothetical protein n=1 Tax=Streptomyces sp. NPDC060198 TaxID=3347070 RepID=UPI00364B77C0